VTFGTVILLPSKHRHLKGVWVFVSILVQAVCLLWLLGVAQGWSCQLLQGLHNVVWTLVRLLDVCLDILERLGELRRVARCSHIESIVFQALHLALVSAAGLASPAVPVAAVPPLFLGVPSFLLFWFGHRADKMIFMLMLA